MDIHAWAENITKDIYLEYKNKYFFWKHGIKVFYSPVIANPPLMIISYQPGGTEKNFEEEDGGAFKKGNFQLQNFNSYLDSKYTLARKVRNFFDFDGGLKILKTSVVFPLIFFRAPTISTWRKDIPKLTRQKMEEFSFSKVQEIIEKLQPQKILILGIETYDRLKDILSPIENEAILYTRKTNGGRMAVSANFGRCRLFAIIHPSGARVSKADWNSLKKLFEEEVCSLK